MTRVLHKTAAVEAAAAAVSQFHIDCTLTILSHTKGANNDEHPFTHVLLLSKAIEQQYKQTKLIRMLCFVSHE